MAAWKNTGFFQQEGPGFESDPGVFLHVDCMGGKGAGCKCTQHFLKFVNIMN